MTVTTDLVRVLADGDPTFSEFDVPLDDTLNEVAGVVEAAPSSNKYDWVHFEKLLADTSQLLDRCLGYRREFMELTGAAVSFLLDQTYQDEANQNLAKLETSEWILGIREFEQRQMEEASRAQQARGTEASSALSDGSLAAAKIAGQAAAGEKSRIAEVRLKWSTLEAHRKRVKAVHEDQGGPLAFSDRARRVRVLIEQDYQEALEKIKSIKQGLQACYSIQSPQPLSPIITPIDREVLWVREAIRTLENEQRWRQVVTVVINARDVLATPEGRIDPAEDNVTHMIDTFGGFAFKLGRKHEIFQDDLVISYGCSLEVDNAGAYPAPGFIRSSVWVRGAYYNGGRLPFGDGTYYDHFPEAPFPVCLSAVSLDRPRDEHDWADTTVAGNYPAAGTWSFNFWEMSSGSTAHLVDRHRVTNLLIYLRLSRKMKNMRE